MKTILVPVDFTKFSENAVRFAGYFAKKKGMTIKLLHIIVESNNNLLPFIESKDKKNYMPELKETAEKQLSNYAEQLIPKKIEKTYKVISTKKSITDEILAENCDLIVMGRRRSENKEAFWVGSHAEKIVRFASPPVITVSEFPEDYKIRNIAFASDFKETKTKPVIQRMFDLANIFDAELNLVYVQLNRDFINTDSSKDKINTFMEDLNLQSQNLNIYVSDLPEEGITRYVEENPTDLLCMCTHGRTGLAHFFRQSVAENISAYSTVPVLTYNINKDKIDRSTKPIARRMIKQKIKEDKKQ
jgi:nucleotide-binding universal stress UspA family protein